MWPRLVFLLVFCHHASLQPTSNDANKMRHARQPDFEECCPCPSKIPGNNRESDKDNMIPRASSIENCPCPLRNADSEGASSIFFPNAVRADRPFMRSNNPKEDTKNLLEPEVGLASSVLETLREATEEEYQDALVRDAARMAIEAEEAVFKDAMPEESARSTVTVILNPEMTSDREDDFVSEASHVQESRCIHPLGSSSLGKMRLSASKPPILFNDIRRMPKARPQSLLHKNLLDMDSYVGASNVEERRVDNNGGIQRYKSHSPLLKQYTAKNNILKSNVDDFNINRVPYFTPASILDKLNEPLQRGSSILESYSIPSISRNKIDGKPINENKKYDLNIGSNKVQEISDHISNKVKEFPKLTKYPINFKNPLKLKDVELISHKNSANKAKDTVKLNTPKLDLSQFLNRDTVLKTNLNCEDELKEAKPIKNTQSVSKGTNISNQERDLETSPSDTDFREIQHNSDECENEDSEPKQGTEEQAMQGVKLISTEILDTVTSPSEVDSSVTFSSGNVEGNRVQPKENPTDEDNSCDSGTQSNDNTEEIINMAQTEPNEETQDENSNEVIFILVDDEQPDVDDEVVDTTHIDQLGTESKENGNDIQECFENTVMDRDQDATDNDNNVVAVFSQEQMESLDPQEKLITNFRNTEYGIQENPSLHTKKTDISKMKSVLPPLTSLKHEFKKKENIKNTSKFLKQATLSSTEGHNDVGEEDDESNLECINDDSAQITTAPIPVSINQNLEDGVDASDPVSFQDLQTLSDSILNESTKKEETTKCDFNNSEIGSDASSDETENITSLKDNLPNSNVKEEDVVSDSNSRDITENSCPNNSDTSDSTLTLSHGEDSKQNLKSNSQPNEMTAEASDPFINTVSGGFLNPFKSNNLRSSQLQDIIVQPSSLTNGDFNLFGKPVGDIFNLNKKLPTLDDLRLRLSNIFNTDERSAEDEFPSAETDCTNDIPSTFDPVMSTDASTSNFVTKLSSLKPLEDINIDIFQLSPSTRTQSDWLGSPRLNLNSYRAKLPIPKNLDLKPVKLESTLGTKSGILGASITTGSNRLGPARITKPGKKTPEILGNPLENLPSLDDLKDSLLANTKSLLTTPLRQTNLFTDNLRSSQATSDFSENLRSHAENAMRNIQQTVKSTLKESKLNDFNLLGDSKSHQEILEMVSRTRDDLNDKLKGLHYDLNDRLASMHENLFDQSRLMTNNRPIIKEITTGNSNNKQLGSPRQSISTLKSSKPTNVQTIARRKELQKKDPSGTSERNDFGKTQAKYTLDKFRIPAVKMPAAGSTPVPKSVEPPKFKPTITKSSLSHIERAQNLKKYNGNIGLSKATEDNPSQIQPIFKDMQRPTLRKNVYPFKDTKIKISFSTTTARPTSNKPTQSRQMLTTTPAPKVGTFRTPRPFSDSGRERVNLPKVSDARGAASERNPSRISALARSPNNSKSNLENIDLPVLSQTTKKHLKGPPLLKQLPKTNDKNKADLKKDPYTKEKFPLQSLIWPKISDNSFLSKVREAVLARLTNTDAIKPTDDNVLKSGPNVDMLRSASEISDTVVKEPLKENVSYKCRMVCTRED